MFYHQINFGIPNSVWNAYIRKQSIYKGAARLQSVHLQGSAIPTEWCKTNETWLQGTTETLELVVMVLKLWKHAWSRHQWWHYYSSHISRGIKLNIVTPLQNSWFQNPTKLSILLD